MIIILNFLNPRNVIDFQNFECKNDFKNIKIIITPELWFQQILKIILKIVSYYVRWHIELIQQNVTAGGGSNRISFEKLKK